MGYIYIVEDDISIREIEMVALKNLTYKVEGMETARELYKKIEEHIPDLIVLDVMLPDEDGYEIVKKLRSNANTKNIPIMMVTAKTTEIDMIRGLDMGADDYIKKPFSVIELITRAKVLLRRNQQEEEKSIQIGTVCLNHERHQVTVDDETIELTFKEYELLRLLMSNVGRVMSRDIIMNHVWDTDFEGESRTVDMHIKTLRKKLKDEGKRIRTVRNVGYVME